MLSKKSRCLKIIELSSDKENSDEENSEVENSDDSYEFDER